MPNLHLNPPPPRPAPPRPSLPEILALYIHLKEVNGWPLTEAQRRLSERVLDDIHFDIVVAGMVVNAVVWSVPLQLNQMYGDSTHCSSGEQPRNCYDCNYSDSDYYDCLDNCQYSFDDDYFGEPPSCPNILDHFLSVMGLTMDIILFINCCKNYKHIYPTVMGIAGVTLVSALQSQRPFLEVVTGFRWTVPLFLFNLVVSSVLMLRQFYTMCNRGELCCNGYGTGIQIVGFFTSAGLNIYGPLSLAMRDSSKACAFTDSCLGQFIFKINDALNKIGRGRKIEPQVTLDFEEAAPSAQPGAQPGAQLPGAQLPGAQLPGAQLPGAQLQLPSAQLQLPSAQLQLPSAQLQLPSAQEKIESPYTVEC